MLELLMMKFIKTINNDTIIIDIIYSTFLFVLVTKLVEKFVQQYTQCPIAK